jgi:hypothetical protein
MNTVILLLFGLIFGVLVSMGLGGGNILILMLTFLIGVAQKTAQTISLVAFIPISILVLIIHFKSDNIEKRYLPVFLVVGGAFALLLSFVTSSIDNSTLRNIYGVFIIIAGVYQLTKVLKAKNG